MMLQPVPRMVRIHERIRLHINIELTPCHISVKVIGTFMTRGRSQTLLSRQSERDRRSPGSSPESDDAPDNLL